jgi:hypothetical protein
MAPLTCVIWLNNNVTCGVLKIILQSSGCSTFVRLSAVLIASLYAGFLGGGVGVVLKKIKKKKAT